MRFKTKFYVIQNLSIDLNTCMLTNVEFLSKICDYRSFFTIDRHHHFEIEIIRKTEKNDILDRIDELIVIDNIRIFYFSLLNVLNFGNSKCRIK